MTRLLRRELNIMLHVVRLKQTFARLVSAHGALPRADPSESDRHQASGGRANLAHRRPCLYRLWQPFECLLLRHADFSKSKAPVGDKPDATVMVDLAFILASR